MFETCKKCSELGIICRFGNCVLVENVVKKLNKKNNKNGENNVV